MNRESIKKQAGIAALEDLEILVAVHDAENNILWANRCYREATGLPLPEIEGKKCHAVWGLDKPCRNCPVIETLRTGKIAEAKLSPKNQDHSRDSPGTWLSKAQPIKDDEGEVVGAIEIAYDIGEQTRSEEALRESEARLAEAQRIAHVGYWDVDLKSGEIAWSDELYRIMQVDLNAQLDLDSAMREFTHPDDKALVEQAFQDAMATGDLPPFEFKSITKAGEDRVLWSKGKVIKNADGEPVRFMGINQDVTERKKAEKEREELQTQLAQARALESVGRLAGGVAHDYNNMLSVILGHTEMAMEKTDPDHPLYANLKEVLAAANRSRDITRQLLAYARKQAVAPAVLDLNDTVARMLKMLKRLIGEDVDLAWQPGTDVWPVKMDPSQIDQILANLSVNARDAIAGVGKVTIQTASVTLDKAYCSDHAGFLPGDFVRLEVSDNGCGMDEEIRGSIFEPFFSTKSLNQGSGLGLATVYGIVKQNNGFIHVSSEPKIGTAFKLYLPRHEGKVDKMSAENTAGAPVGRGETVLLVEDEPAIMNLGKIMLEKLGYHAVAARSPSEALRQAAEHVGGVDLLITDVVMPEMNGRELADQLRSLYPKMKTLFMSGYTADVIARRGVLEDDLNFIQKPFTVRDLGVTIRTTLDQK